MQDVQGRAALFERADLADGREEDGVQQVNDEPPALWGQVQVLLLAYNAARTVKCTMAAYRAVWRADRWGS